MRSATEVDRSDRLVAGYAALAIGVHLLEAGLPSPLPGVKPGLANVIVLLVLLRHGWRAAAWVAVLRVLVGSLLVGSFLAPTFWLSAAGALASLAALAVGSGWNRAWRQTWPPAQLSALGLSAAAALAHMAGQFALAYGWFAPHPGLLRLLPVLMLAALAFGIASGWAAAQILARLPPVQRPLAGA